jgi:large subunit ribosomal protein L4
MALLHQAVVAQQANRRQGTQDTLTRGEVSYSTRKLRAQKHTGRSRLGSRKSPAMRGGGVAHGPHPRSYNKGLPKKMRQQALRVALADHVRSESLTVVSTIDLDVPKTSTIKSMVQAFELKGRALIVTADKDDVLMKSCSNLEGIQVREARNLSAVETISAPNLVITQEAVGVVNSLWGKGAAEK